jgi:hypothetical protein
MILGNIIKTILNIFTIMVIFSCALFFVTVFFPNEVSQAMEIFKNIPFLT